MATKMMCGDDFQTPHSHDIHPPYRQQYQHHYNNHHSQFNQNLRPAPQIHENWIFLFIEMLTSSQKKKKLNFNLFIFSKRKKKKIRKLEKSEK